MTDFFRARLPLVVVPLIAPAAAALFLAWREHGSFTISDWSGYALVVALVLGIVVAFGAGVRPSRLALVGLACMCGLAVWDVVSLRWSSVPSLARDEGLLVLLYAATAALPLFLLREERDRSGALGIVAFALGLLALAGALKLRTMEGDLRPVYTDGRLAFPVTYVNGEAALLLLGMWPAIELASRRALNVFVRAAALGLAALDASLFVSTQSKGALLGLIVSTVVLFAVAPARLRLVWPFVLALGLAGAAYVPLSEPYRQLHKTAFTGAVHHAANVALAVGLIGAAVGVVYATADRFLAFPRWAIRAFGFALVALVAVVVVGGATTFLVKERHPGRFVAHRWHDFTHHHRGTYSTHFVALGSHRYDFWRVAAREFVDHPIAGIGARGFGPDYLLHRTSVEFPRRSHSLELDTLGETGIVGFLLLAGAFVSLFWVAARQARGSPGAAVALAAAAGWLIHASVDWIWTLPSVGIPLFLLLGIAGGEIGPNRRPVNLAGPVGALLVVLAFMAFFPPWIAGRYLARADYHAARSWDPLATDADVAEGFASNPPRIGPLRDAANAQPRRFELHLFLALAYQRAGQASSAKRQAAIAVRLDPHDPLLRADLRKAGIRLKS